MKKRPGLASLAAVYRRELLAYVTTPTAYVFVAVFLFSIGLFTFQIGGFFASRQADLTPFFAYHPWIFMIFLPAVAMRLWALSGPVVAWPDSPVTAGVAAPV